MKQIKCSNCGEWNTDRDNCDHCAEPISRELIEEIREEKREIERGKNGPSLDEVIMQKARESKNVFVKFGYYSFYFLTMIAISIGAFGAWMIAMLNA